MSRVSNKVTGLETQILDAENRSRRCNLLFYRLPGVASGIWAESETKRIIDCTERFSITLEEHNIERIHRGGKVSTGTGDQLLSNFAL